MNLLPVEIGLFHRKSMLGTHAWEDEVQWSDLLELEQTQTTVPRCPGSHPQPAGLALSRCGSSPALSSPRPEEGPGSRNSVPLVRHRQGVQRFHSSVQSMPKFIPAPLLSSSGSLPLCPGCALAAAPRPTPGPAWLPAHATALERPREWATVLLTEAFVEL